MDNNMESAAKQLFDTERGRGALQGAAMRFLEEPEYDRYYALEISNEAGITERSGYYAMEDITPDEDARVSLVQDLIGAFSIELASQIRNTPEGKKLLDAAWAALEKEHLPS